MTDDPYADGTLYDLEYAGHIEDVPWYVEHACQAGGPVLELGCGTGRLTLPIARAGVPITGVDRAPAMLAGLRRKLTEQPPSVRQRVRLLEGDYAHITPGDRYASVLWPFNAIHHLDGPSEVQAVLRRIRTWLRPGGTLALDCYLPDIELYDRDPTARYEPRTFTDPRSGHPLYSWEQGWWDGPRRLHHVQYVYQHPDGREERAHLVLRMYERPELLAMAEATGWSVRHEAMDFEGEPVRSDALKWVAVLA